MSVGILIATKNRSKFLISQLRYYVSVKSPYTLYIGDSSNQEHAEKTLQVIDELKGKLNMVYRSFPHFNCEMTQRELANSIKEKYAILTGDDDTVIPQSINRCVQFLEANPDYCSAHGRGILLSTETDGKSHRVFVNEASKYRLLRNEASTGSQRLDLFLTNYWNSQFAVSRTEVFRLPFDYFNELLDRHLAETICGCILMIKGKSKALDGLHLVRQAHSGRAASFAENSPSPSAKPQGAMLNSMDWITHPNWQPSYQAFHDRLVELLAENDRISAEEASKVVVNGLRKYLLTRLSPPSQGYCSKFQQNITNIPGLRTVYRYLKTKTPMNKKKINLPNLLDPTSPYHHDFMPIYNMITTQ